MVPPNGVEDVLRALSISLGKVHADGRVTTFHLMIHGLANVVQETSSASNRAVKPKLFRNHLRQESDLDGMPKNILTIRSSEMQTAHHLHHLLRQSLDPRLNDRVLTLLANSRVDVSFRFGHILINLGGIYPPVGHHA